MDTQLVESIYRVIQSLLEEKLSTNLPYPSQQEIITLAEMNNVSNFLNDEPDLYSLQDGEAF